MALLIAPGALCAREASEDPLFESSLGGRLSWVQSSELDLIGEMWADAPFRVGERNSIFVSAFLRTVISQTDSLTFLVRDIEYSLDAGWRGTPTGLGAGRRLSAFAGERGKRLVDADGEALIRYVAAGAESERFRSYDPARDGWVEWSAAVGPVLQSFGIDAVAMLRGAARFRLAPPGSRIWRRFGADLIVDGVYADGELQTDVTIGPRFSFPVEGGRRASLYVHYMNSRNPLGPTVSTWLAGLEFSEGPGDGPRRRGAPEVDGVGELGFGDRLLGGFLLAMRSPIFLRRFRLSLLLDANVMPGQTTNDLFYNYQVGAEHVHGSRVLGFYYYHRSNHQLGNPGPVTSLDVIEFGARSENWQDPGRRDTPHRCGRLEGGIYVGWLQNSSFGQQDSWRVRAGGRWTLPVGGRWGPFLEIEVESGEVERLVYAIGFTPGRTWDVQVEYLHDEQLFDPDRHVVLLNQRYGF